jgi:hypothetical protein
MCVHLIAVAHAKRQVLLLDAQVGPFDETIYRRVFSPRHRVLRAADLAAIVARHSPPTEVTPRTHSHTMTQLMKKVDS